MLEVLDPEQNSTFRDHYLDVPFDLSTVMFIATANTLDTIPAPLLDRMEVIQIAGYTEEEKLQIAKRYLVPRQIERNGLKKSQVGDLRPRAARGHPRLHARGRRAPARARDRLDLPQGRAAGRRGDGRAKRVSVSEPKVRELLGRPRFFARGAAAHARPGRGDRPGVDAGRRRRALRRGDARCPATGKLTITGQLGDVMRESAQAALSWVRGHAEPSRTWFAEHDLHIHVPAGAIPEGRAERGRHDGDRADVAASTGRRVRDDVAMTGEMTLHRRGAADRRAEGEGARRAAPRDQDTSSRRRSTSRTSRRSPSTCASSSSSTSSSTSRRCCASGAASRVHG